MQPLLRNLSNKVFPRLNQSHWLPDAQHYQTGMKAREQQRSLLPGTVSVSSCSDSDISPWVGARIRPSKGNQAGNTALGWPWGELWLGRAHGWAGQACGETDTSLDMALLWQGLIAPGVL